MSGRGDNNKHGSAGQGATNQSNQPFAGDADDQSKSNHNKKATGGKPSDPSPKTADQDADRNTHLKDQKQQEK
jgi:hypothetical protein